MGVEYKFIHWDLDTFMIPDIVGIVEEYVFTKVKRETYYISIHCSEQFFRTNFGLTVFSPKFYWAIMYSIANYDYIKLRFLENDVWGEWKECSFTIT